MILHFPSFDQFRIALVSGVVPARVQVAQAYAIFSSTGQIFVTPSEEMNPVELDRLQKLGIDLAKIEPLGEVFNACCWLQLLDLESALNQARSLDKATVLFRVESPTVFASLVSEMLRQGNDRQSFRHVHNSVRQWTLLRVIDPPYYSLLRAIEAETPAHNSKNESTEVIDAFVEQAPRVWVQLGYRHPLADRIDPPAGEFVLIGPSRNWHFVSEAAFQEIYSALDLRLPKSQQHLPDRHDTQKISVPLRLKTGGTNEPAELWVLQDHAMEQVEQLVLRSDDELLSRLAFAVVETSGDPIVVIRTRPSRRPPPVLVLDGQAYRAYLKLSNLFVPVGKRLHPPLRRDAIGKILAADNRCLTWLSPPPATDQSENTEGEFVPLSVSDSAFRPLSDWVEYVLAHDHQALEAWIASHSFAFEPFVCRDDAPKSDSPKSGHKPANGSPAQSTSTLSAPPATSPPSTSKPPNPLVDTLSAMDSEPQPSSEKPTANEFKERLQNLERAFLALTEAIDGPQRKSLWRSMAILNSHLGHRNDTTICWTNAIWNDSKPDIGLLEEWLHSELRSSGRQRIDIKSIDEILSRTGTQDAALVGVYLLFSLASQKGVNDLKRRATELTRFFESQESQLPVRAVWMFAMGMHSLNERDTLGLARARDRLLERLFRFGLQPEFDIVGFMRDGSGTSDRPRILRTRLPSLFDSINRWIVGVQNRAYARFIAAFGLAQMGEVAAARDTLAIAMNDLNRKDVVHRWLGNAYVYRIEQSINSVIEPGQLPTEMLEYLEMMEELERYKVDRLRQQSRILEPHERIDPYRRWHRRYSDQLFLELAELQDQSDHAKVKARIKALLIENPKGSRAVRVLATALELAPRFGEQFADELLTRIEPIIAHTEDAIERALVLQRSIYMCAHFGKAENIQHLVNMLEAALPRIVDDYLSVSARYSPEEKERVETVEALFLQSFRGLRKLGMREAIGRLYGLVEEQVSAYSATKKKLVDQLAENLLRPMRLMLCVASGWYYFDRVASANQVVNRVRSALLEGQLSAVDQRGLAVAYAQTVAQAPIEIAFERIAELFNLTPESQRLIPKIEDNLTTITHFSISQLELVEASVLSLLSDRSSLSAELQRWLDEDEFFVRKRVHADMKQAL